MIINKGPIFRTKPIITGKGVNRASVREEPSDTTPPSVPSTIYEKKVPLPKIPNDPTKRLGDNDLPVMGKGVSNIIKDLSALNFRTGRKKKGVVLKL